LKKPKKGDTERDQADMERLMEDLEEDPEMRSKVNLYRKEPRLKKAEKDGKSSSLSKSQKVGSEKKGKIQSDKEKKEEREDDEDVPQVPNEELIDDLTEAMGTMSTGKSSDLLNIGPEEGDELTF